MTRNRWSFFKTIIGACLILNQVSAFAASEPMDRPADQVAHFTEPLWYQEATSFFADDPDISLTFPDARMTGAGESVPTVTATVASDIICSGTATSITLSGSIPGTNFAWTVVQYGVSGASAGTGNSILQILNATGIIAGEVVYTITPEYNGIYGTPIDVSIFVKPKPTATGTPSSQSICSGETATIVLTGTVPGTTFNWSVLSATRVTEVKSGDTGSGSTIVQNFTNYTASSGTVVYVVTPTVNGCNGDQIYVFVNVLAMPTPGAITGDQAICAGETPATITSVTAGTGSATVSYIWEKSTDGENWTQVYQGSTPDLVPPVVFENTQFRRITVSTTASGKACYSEPTAPVTISMGGDDLPPTFTVPAPATVSLRADCTANTGPAVTGFPYNVFDNCSDPSGITVEYEDSEPVQGACPGTYSFVRTWTVTDETNLSSSQDQTITVIDQTKPILSIPPTRVVDCRDNTDPAFTGQATATDNCGGTVVVTYTDDVTAGSCPQNSTILRNWTATDCSGNRVTAVQTILARDTQKPEVFMQDLYVQCPGDIPPAYPNLAAFIADGNIVSDNCGSVRFIVFDEIAHGLEEKPGYCPNRLTRYYRVTDGCGNDTEVAQEIYIADECGCSPCLDGVNFFFVDMSNDPYAEFTVPSTVRNGTCCDAKFNDRCIAFNIILHKDAIGIEISINGATPQPHEWDVDCRDVKIINGIVCLPTGQFHLFTFCKPGANPEDYTFRSVPGVVAAEGITTRMECSQQLFTEGIQDRAMWNSVWPGTPGQYNHYLSSLTDPNPFFYADVNSPPVIKYEVCGYIGTNSCNDLGMDCDTITVNVRPLIELAWDNDPTIVCEDDIPPLVAQISPIDAVYQFEWFNGYDATGTPVYTGSNSYTPPGEGQYSIRVTDLDEGVPCGSKVFNFDVIYDTTPASVFGPPDGDLTVECNGSTAFQEINDWLKSAYALDDDGSSIPVYWDYSGINMACGTSLPVTFLATDKCGNEGSVVAYIHVIDTQAPTILRQAQDDEAECFGNDPNDNSFFNNWLASRGGATASDDCDRSLIWTNNYDPLNWSGNPCDNRITVTFFVTDDCENTSQTVATFRVTDTQPPIIASCPPPVIGEPDDAECYATNVVLGTPSAVDLCSSVTWTNNAPAQFPVGQTVVIWTASDACGNKATCLQNVNIYDNNQPPTIVCPPNVTATAEPGDCDVPVTSIEPPIADDNCGIVLQIWMMTGATTGISPRTGINDVNGQVFNVGTTVVTYTVADQAGNRASCSFTVTVEDQTNPVIENCPGDITANAAPDQCEQYILVPQPDAYDPCGQEITITHDSPYGISVNDASGDYPVGVTVIIWTVTDSSGNSTTCTQTITVNDVQAPELTCPSDQEDTAEPGDCFLVNFEMPDPVYSDNCPNPTLTYTMSGATTGSGAGSVSGFTFNVGVTTVTYTVTDASNNSTSCSFNVWVKDLLPPELTNGCPDDILGVVVPAGDCDVFVNMPAPQVTDPCDEGYTVTNSHTGTADASGSYPVGKTTVIWTITDASGNITTCEQLVEVIDNEAPVITFCPEDVEQTTTTDNCELESVYIDDPVYTDNCSTPVLTYEMTYPDGSTASGNGSVSGMTFPVGVTTVIYTVTNSSGVSTSCSFTVWIKDLVKPEFTNGCPDDIGPVDAASGVCEVYISIPAPEVYDPCNEGYTIINSYTGTADASGIYPVGTTTIVWTVTDASGNENHCEQTVTVVDNEDPVWAQSMPSDEDVECDDIPLLPADISATDNCDIQVDVSYDEKRTDGPCPDTYILTRTWTATDDYGNSITHVQTITVHDTQAPQLTGTWPAGQNNLNTCFNAIPEGPTAEEIASLYTDNCGNVNVVKSATPTGNNCSWSVTYTYRISDDCNNYAADVTITYSGGDTQAPVWTVAMPSDITVECSEVPAAPANITATDNCEGTVTVSYSETKTNEDADCEGSYTLIRSWTADDNCGNVTVHTQTITVRDTQAPVWTVAMPSDITVECDEVPEAPANITATDNCEGTVTVSYSETKTNEDADCEGSYTLIRSWTADDNCGNVTVHTQTITVRDTQAPVWTVAMPSDITVECDEVPEAPANITATDNCEGTVTVSYSETKTNEDADCEGSYTLIRSWTADDNCGNVTVHTQTITVRDTQAPVWTVAMPSDITVECSEVPAAPANITATDNCEGTVTVSYSETKTNEDADCEGSYTLIRSWTADDNCGNVTVHTQTITVRDTQAPVWTVAMPSDITVECDEVPEAPANITATDNCEGTVTVSYSETKTNEDADCEGSYTLIRSWTADDNCGNVTVHTQTITVRDTQAPVWTVAMPSDITVECDEVPEAPANITATDNCEGTVTVSYSETKTNEDADCEGSYTLIRSWTADDNCGNVTVHTQTITVRDTQAPVWTVAMPSDITVECSEVPAAPANITATDNCEGTVTVSYSETKTNEDADCEGSYTLIRSWTADDNCGNVTVHTQTITVRDTQAPVWTVAMPSDITVECDEVPEAPANITATDNCEGTVTVSYSETKTNEDADCEGSYTLIRSWTADDNCGNVTVHTQTITVRDTQAPVWTVAMPSDITVECSDEIPTAPANITATDNCEGTVTVSYSETKTNEDADCEGSYTLIRSWTADDNCGNVTVHTQTITVRDTQAPVWTVAMPSDITVECDEIPTAPADITATDNCEGTVTVSYSETKTNEDADCEGSYTLIRSWTADDNCGNVTVHTQTITVRDTQAPVWTVAMPSDITVECDEVPEAPANITATDNCEGTVTVSYSETKTNEDADCEGSYTLIRSWTADDNCGNVTVHTQTITVRDTQAPVWTVAMPSDITVECSEVPEAPANITATDNCEGTVTVSYSETKTNEDADCEGSYTLIRSWTADDNCGNVTVHTQTITVRDTQVPVWTVAMPSDITVECSEVPEAPANITATDNCEGTVTVSYSETKTNEDADCEGSYTLIRSWTADDNCGNVTVHTQTITVRDTQAPVWTVAMPSDITVECDEVPEAPANITATDNCEGTVTVSYSETKTNEDADCEGSYTLIRSWTADDNCGNVTVHTQTITVRDTQAPVWTVAMPSDITVECDEVPEAPANITATDNCEGTVTVSYSETKTNEDADCEGSYTLIRSWTADDNCGNVTVHTQTITVRDTQAPVWTVAMPSDITVECSEVPAAPANITATDNCEGTVTVSYSETKTNEDADCEGSYTLIRSWTADDNCGNVTVHTQTITVRDTQAPVIDPSAIIPEGETDMDLCFGAIPEGPAVDEIALLYTDNCSNDIVVTKSGTPSGSDCSWTVTYIYHITDGCGNAAEDIRITYSGGDRTNPVMTCPAALTAVCDLSEQPAYANFAQFTAAGGFASDNCAVNPASFKLISEISDHQTCPETVVRTYELADNCGNTVSCEQTITVDPRLSVLTHAIPENTVVDACNFATQADLDQAFAQWLASFTVSGGCSPNTVFSTTTAPQLCAGGLVTVVMDVTDLCDNLSVQATFELIPSPELTVERPENMTADACNFSSQAELNTAFAQWLSGFSFGGGCSPNSQFSTTTAPDLCTGGTVTVVMDVTDLCVNTSVNATFELIPAPGLTLSQPSDMTVSACNFTSQSEVDALFTQWLTGFAVAGGCSPNSQFSTTTAPDLCAGGTVTVVMNVTDLCVSTSVQASFILATPAELAVSKPLNTTVNTCAFASQAELDAAFAEWMNGFTVSGGCAPVETLSSTIAPELCGGSVTVTMSVTDVCRSESVSASYTVNPPSSLPQVSDINTTVNACDYAGQESLDNGFAAWITGIENQINLSGGCDRKLTNDLVSVQVPDLCTGGTAIVNWMLTDLCDTATFQSRYTVNPAPALSVAKPADQALSSCNFASQQDLDRTFTQWMNEFRVSGGCRPVVSLSQANAPELCTGGTVNVTLDVADLCDTISVNATFELSPAPALVVVQPADTSINACDFVSQAELNTAFAQWLSRFGHNGGCNPAGNYGTPAAPDICGGSVTVTYQIADLCETASVSAVFTINPPTQPVISLSAALPDTLSCSEADAYRVAPNATYTNGETGACLLSGTVPAKVIPAWDKCSGGIITVEYTATDKCGFVLTESYVITVLQAPAPVVTLPALPDTLSCDQARAYTSAPNASYTNNESGTCMIGGAIHAKLIQEWNKCDGGFITVEYAKTDDCGYEMTVSHVITVLPAPEPSVSLPGSLPASLTWKQAETYTSAPNATYSNYESGACLVSGSIPAVLTANWDDCNGGIITVDYTATDECGFELSISHVITVEPAPEPTAFAGNRQIICLGDDIFMSDATAGNYSGILWTTNGDGSFVRPDMLNPRYLPGPEDIATGAVLLTLTAENMSSNCDSASSVMELFIIGQDKAQYVTSEVLCEQDLPYSWYEHTIQRGGTYESKIETPDGCYDLAILHLEVIPDNLAPEVVDDSYVVEVNTTRSMPVLENDSDPNGVIDPTTIRIVDNARHGMVSVNQRYELVYTPNSNFMGKDQFTYSVCDDGDPCNVYCGQARVNIDILPPGQDKECEFFIPDGFSPNGDGLHDYFQIYCIQKYPEAKLMIFDRQGNLLYEKKNYGNQIVWGSYEEAHWNGESTKHHQNSRRRVEPGVYLYVLDRGNGELDKGFVMVSY